jgi:hypothetical protein
MRGDNVAMDRTGEWLRVITAGSLSVYKRTTVGFRCQADLSEVHLSKCFVQPLGGATERPWPPQCGAFIAEQPTAATSCHHGSGDVQAAVGGVMTYEIHDAPGRFA